jgi:trimeric autotransporter adhesin
LVPFVSVDPNPEIGVAGPHIIFSGANIHIVSGSGATNDHGNPTGLGNLIIGYDEDPVNYFAGGPGGGIPLSPGDRSGSHNLVIGVANRFTEAASGGLVAGALNTIRSPGASVTGGELNTASGSLASVSGGIKNTASGIAASVSGGGANTADGGEGASVSGGALNTASGSEAAVSGGFGNTAGGFASVVIGGQNVIDNNNNSISPQPPFP